MDAAFMLHSKEQFVIVADVLIIPAYNQVIVGGLRCAALQQGGARVGYSERDSCQAGHICAPSTRKSVLSACRARGCVPDAEELVVERHRSRADIVQVGDYCMFELLSPQVNRNQLRNHEADAFVFHEEEGFVFPDRSTK